MPSILAIPTLAHEETDVSINPMQELETKESWLLRHKHGLEFNLALTGNSNDRPLQLLSLRKYKPAQNCYQVDGTSDEPRLY